MKLAGLWNSLIAAWLLLGLAPAAAQDEPVVTVGSKSFTESRILAEMMAQMIEAHTSIRVRRRFSLGGTKICFGALEVGGQKGLDLYPEYTGTGLVTILKRPPRRDPLMTYAEVQREFQVRYGLTWLAPFGFSNTYAMAMPEATAERLQVTRLSDLAKHAEQLRFGVTHEFLARKDGFPGLKAVYGVGAASVRGMEHGLAYQAIASGEIDVIDAYSTDGKLLRYKLRVLEDDQGLFPHYHAAPLIRLATLQAHPELQPLLGRLAVRLPAKRIQELNYLVEVEKRSVASVAREFLVEEGLLTGVTVDRTGRGVGLVGAFRSRWRETLVHTGEHLSLTAKAVLLACLFAIPLGVVISRHDRLAPWVLGGAGVMQTIPSLALLALMIPVPFLGLEPRTAIAALFLYALLPIVRNTYTGIRGVDADLIEAARGMGLTDRQILVHVELPLATRTIMAGVRTATVISVGVATLAAFIGAGGLGTPILTGLSMADNHLILTGAIPAAALAIVIDLLLGLVERALVPRGLED